MAEDGEKVKGYHKLNNYLLEAEEIGKGGFATVYKGAPPRDSKLAFKVFFFENFHDIAEDAITEAKAE